MLPEMAEAGLWQGLRAQYLPTDVERAGCRAGRGCAGCLAAVRLDAGHSRESFAVAVESRSVDDPAQVRRIEHEVAHEVVTEVAVRPRYVVVLAPGALRRDAVG
jgi:fatty-acyl-CoA synthase